MVNLYIDGKLVDINDDVDIQLDKSFDNDELVTEASEYSFDISLPITENNRKAFGFADVFDVANKFDRTFDAVLNVDDVTILDGKFLLQEINSEEYSGNLFVPASLTLKDVLGDKKMKDINPHPMYINTWAEMDEINEAIKGNTATDKHICFPYVLYKLPYNVTGTSLNNYTQDLSASGNSFSTENIFPAYNVLSVLKDCFAGEGLKLQGNIFSNAKFNELYQTFSSSFQDYKKSKNTPYYLNFTADYMLRRGNNTSSTALQSQILYDSSDNPMLYGTDAILLSENSIINEISDEYNMLVKGTGSDGRSIIIPKTGWYRIRCNGSMKYPFSSGYWKQDNRIPVNGCYNDADRVDLSQNVFEFQIKKTSAPMSSVNLYSFNLATPMVPTNMSDKGVYYAYPLQGGKTGLKLSYDTKRNRFAKNGQTALVKDYSGFDTSEFIAGARLGCQFNSPTYDESRLPDRLNRLMIYSCLPDPTKASPIVETDDAGVQETKLEMYRHDKRGEANSDDYRKDYGSKTAQVLVRDDSYSNFEGYNILTPNADSDGGTWNTSNNESRSFAGMQSSVARALTKFEGDWTINTCVWLEEGEMISLEVLMPHNDYRDKCGWLETCSWKHRDRQGIVATNVNIEFQIGIVSADEKYVPTPEQPIKTFDEIMLPSATNVNQWLGDTKVNDYIENFCQTFNVRLSKVNKNTYSLDSSNVDEVGMGNIINIDEWANVHDASFERLNSTNISLGWTISTDEEGYVHGNNTKQVKTPRDESGYTGSIEFINDGNDKDKQIKSNWSYTWVKDISFVNGDYLYTSGVEEVPVVGDAEIWNGTYQGAEEKEYQTDKTSRLFYLDRNLSNKICRSFNVRRKKNDSNIVERKMSLLFVKNYLKYRNIFGEDSTFRLDYNNTYSKPDDKTITDVFFNIKKGYQYEVDVPVTLPNDIYSSIRSNTLVKFNDCLFKVLGIEGHDVDYNQKATLKLVTLD